jgi:uncharacterized protein (DUF2345 family)
VAGETASFYTHAGGIKTFAANGPVSLRAHTDELQILADKDVTVISVNGEIHINAQSKIEIVGADSSIVLEGGDITFTTPGTWAAKASTAAFLGGASAGANMPELPAGMAAVSSPASPLLPSAPAQFSERLASFGSLDEASGPVPYSMTANSAVVDKAKLGANDMAPRRQLDQPQRTSSAIGKPMKMRLPSMALVLLLLSAPASIFAQNKCRSDLIESGFGTVEHISCRDQARN